jgi:hypothetical protein
MDNEENSSLEDNLPMVNYIMLHRIYDIMTLIANELAKDEESRLNISKMIEYHKEGFLLGPSPAYRSEENNG